MKDYCQGSIVTTYTGKRFDPLNPDPDLIDIVDIAHQLACCNRFSGALAGPYSVAEHSVRVSRLLNGPDALAGLLHDSSEAYLGDVPTPLKRMPAWDGYRAAEARLQAAVYAKYGPPAWDAEKVHRADVRMLHSEAWWLSDVRPAWAESYLCIPRFEPWTWRVAENLFLGQFYHLTAVLAADAVAISA